MMMMVVGKLHYDTQYTFIFYSEWNICDGENREDDDDNGNIAIYVDGL